MFPKRGWKRTRTKFQRYSQKKRTQTSTRGKKKKNGIKESSKGKKRENRRGKKRKPDWVSLILEG